MLDMKCVINYSSFADLDLTVQLGNLRESQEALKMGALGSNTHKSVLSKFRVFDCQTEYLFLGLFNFCRKYHDR
jgi:hypothetical protein